MAKRKKKKGGISLAGLTVLGVLCVLFILGDLYLLMKANLSSQVQTTATEQTSAETETPTVSELPQIINAAQPEVSQEAQAEETAAAEVYDWNWQNSWVAIAYDETGMWVSEDNGIIMVTDPQFDDLPRMDIQQLDGADGLTQDEFSILAKAAVRAYFSAEPSSDVVSVTSVTESTGGWTAQLSVAATDASPALNAWVRLNGSILVSMLLPQTTDEETQALWVNTLESVTGQA